jgi:pyruvate,water dikinase
MDVEWAKDEETGKLFILQARPETVHAIARKATSNTYQLQERGPVLVTGKSVGEKIGAGPVHIIKDVAEFQNFRPGEVLVADMTDPDWEPTMKMAAAIVTNRGGRTCHAAIVSRELGVPCIVGTETGTATLRTGQPVTVSCAEGEVGRVYDGMLPFTRQTLEVGALPRPKTKVMLNVGNPDQAFSLSFLPNDGVGLAREEFIISSTIQVHPLALVHFDQLPSDPAKEKIVQLTLGYPHKPDYFVDRLAEGVGQADDPLLPDRGGGKESPRRHDRRWVAT